MLVFLLPVTRYHFLKTQKQREGIEFSVAIFALMLAFMTYFAAKEIAFIQQWDTLLAEYRGHTFGNAVKAISDFFVRDCDGKIHQVREKYATRYKNDCNKPSEDTLNFHRRLLAQYYGQLYLCIKDKWFINSWIREYFNKNEMNLMAIVYAMNLAAENSSLYSSLWQEPTQGRFSNKNEYDVNTYIEKLYNVFKGAFADDKREPQQLIDFSKQQESGSLTEPVYKTMPDYRRITMSAKELYFTNATGAIVHSAYVVKDGILTQKCTTNVKSSAFKNDSTVERILLQPTVTTIEQSAFENCTELQIAEYVEHVNVEDKNEVDVPILSNDENEKINLVASGTPVTVQYAAFKHCKKLHTVVFPKTCDITIEKDAFLGCEALRTVVLWDGDANIDSAAFTSCDSDKLTFVTGSADANCKVIRFAREHGCRYAIADNV